ncbi:hypothetical protein EGM51_01395 [Verrucomicrobia bacterium S94]|nr:hypothetical protein EGM51_01395 [Verrucomicrobia bacterium S94]
MIAEKGSEEELIDKEAEAAALREAWIRELMVHYGQPREFFDEQTLYMIAAFQMGDEALVNARMLELLEKDVSSALLTMAKLDGSFMIFETELPYTAVSDYLLDNYSPDEGMNLMGQLLFSSQSIREVGSCFFQDWAKRDPDGQLKWIADNPSFNSEYIFVDYLKQEMPGENAANIVTAMLNLPLDDARADFLIRESIQLMAVEQPMAASEILNQLPADDPLYFDAVGLLASSAARENGLLGMEWASSIPDPNMRLGAQISAGSSFLANDPDGFYAWFKNAEFEDAPETRDEILKQMETAAELEKSYVPDDPAAGTDRRGLPTDPELRGPVPGPLRGNLPPTQQ